MVNGVMSRWEKFTDPGYWWFSARLFVAEARAAIVWKVAWLLPRRVALIAFVRVYSASGDAPGPEFDRAYKAFEAGAGK